MQYLSDKYNIWIINIYRTTGHGKGLIDVISGFAVKSVLRRYIVTQDYRFQNSSEICEYLDSRCDNQMSDTNLDVKTMIGKQLNK